MRARVAVMGATGSIGTSTLDVIERNPERFDVFALTANTNADALEALIRTHRPRYAVLTEASAAAAGPPASGGAVSSAVMRSLKVDDPPCVLTCSSARS